jgi:hypothetical protein
MMSAQRMSMAKQAAVAAQAQAIASQQAQANAVFPIPAPLTDDQIKQMSAEQASAAMGIVSAALNRTDLTPENRARLQHELESLAQQSDRPPPKPPLDPRIPTTLSDAQIQAMSLAEAQAALANVSVARRNAQNSQDKDRLRIEFGKLLNHVSVLRGNGPITPPDVDPPASRPVAASTKVLPPPLTNDQIDQMTLPEAQAALAKVSVARRQGLATPEEKKRLKAEFERLLLRINALKAGS